MTSIQCSIENCKRAPDKTCEHCQNLVCMKHYLEHLKKANDKLPSLSKDLNDYISSIEKRDFTQHVFEQIELWRDKSHKRIDDLCEEKKKLLKMEIEEKIDKQIDALHELNKKIEELIDEGNASFKEIENMEDKIHEYQEQCDLLTSENHFHIDTENINFDTKLSHQDLFTGGGTLLSYEQQLTLNEFYGKKSQTWALIYKGTRNGFQSSTFHQCCDNQGPTMTIIQSRDEKYQCLFGGYTSVSWRTRQSYVEDNKNPFLFTLTNPHAIPPTKYSIGSPIHAVYDHLNFGPTFGSGFDLSISSHSQTNRNSSVNFPHSYEDTTGKGSTTFTGNRNFQTNEIEVYRLIEK